MIHIFFGKGTNICIDSNMKEPNNEETLTPGTHLCCPLEDPPVLQEQQQYSTTTLAHSG